ncbi:MAG: M24 family metallopeptidase [Pseudomonadota bacterium]
MTNAHAVSASPEERSHRLSEVRARMRDLALDGYVVRGTDRYLNEYVPTDQSQRAWLSGFTGSIADLFITAHKAFIYVDGRYYLQADKETDPALFSVVKVPFGQGNEQVMYGTLVAQAAEGVRRVGFEPDRFSVSELASLRRAVEAGGVELVPVAPSLVERVRGPVAVKPGKVRAVDVAITGTSVDTKLHTIRTAMTEHKLDALVVTALDDIAYLSNLRGSEIDFQATFKGVAVVTSGDFVVALSDFARRRELPQVSSPRFVDEAAWTQVLQGARRVGFDEGSATEAVRQAIAGTGAEAVAVHSPIKPMKANKNEAELAHLVDAYRRADKVIWAVQGWLHRRVDNGEKTTEADLAHEVERRFKRSGGTGLSFEVIAAQGANGAIIHYSDPDATKPIAPGTIVLLDTGTYYEGGYATDLTRTFVAGKKNVAPGERQKMLFTLVLKGAIAGMQVRFPEGTKGFQLDAMCRRPLWQNGLQYLHGTGHGVGINVHEMPPRVAAVGSMALEPGQVFSIEPGIYLEGEIGIRIENLVTVVKDPEVPGFLRVVPITFSPLDKRLIDTKLLTREEKAFVKWFEAQWKKPAQGLPELPPLA